MKRYHVLLYVVASYVPSELNTTIGTDYVVRQHRYCNESWSASVFGLLLNPRWRAFTIASNYPCQQRTAAAPICISRQCTVLLVS